MCEWPCRYPVIASFQIHAPTGRARIRDCRSSFAISSKAASFLSFSCPHGAGRATHSHKADLFATTTQSHRDTTPATQRWPRRKPFFLRAGELAQRVARPPCSFARSLVRSVSRRRSPASCGGVARAGCCFSFASPSQDDRLDSPRNHRDVVEAPKGSSSHNRAYGLGQKFILTGRTEALCRSRSS